jgi:hypothetical protein
MTGFASKGVFSITKEPFSDWAKTFNRLADQADVRLNDEIQQVFAKAESALQEAIRQDPVWPDEIADNTSFDVVDGTMKVSFDDMRVPGLEYGDANGSPPAPVLRTFADAHEQNADADLGAAVRRATGL